ncbi:glycosyltransferase [Gordonibacter urolithinfaciens]
MAAIYSAADVFFNPTREDNFPTVNLEAQACGTPVLTYDIGGCGETINLEHSQVIGS